MTWQLIQVDSPADSPSIPPPSSPMAPKKERAIEMQPQKVKDKAEYTSLSEISCIRSSALMHSDTYDLSGLPQVSMNDSVSYSPDVHHM